MGLLVRSKGTLCGLMSIEGAKIPAKRGSSGLAPLGPRVKFGVRGIGGVLPSVLVFYAPSRFLPFTKNNTKTSIGADIFRLERGI